MIKYTIKILRLIIVLLFTVYYIGILTYIAFQLINTFIPHTYEDWFGLEFEFNKKSTYSKMMAMAYFSFTTLSTVGFGDYYANNSGERGFMVFIMVGGIICFSYIMGLFTEILNVFLEIDAPLNEHEQLDKFWGVFKSLNSRPVKETVRKTINEYLEYKWNNDKNLAIMSEDDVAIFT